MDKHHLEVKRAAQRMIAAGLIADFRFADRHRGAHVEILVEGRWIDVRVSTPSTAKHVKNYLRQNICRTIKGLKIDAR